MTRQQHSAGAKGAGVLAVSLLASVGAAAQTTPWTLDLTLYGWLPALEGKVGSRGLVTDIDNSFRDTLEQSDSLLAFMLRAEARRARLGLFVDTVYINLGYEDVAVGTVTRFAFDEYCRTLFS